MMRTRVPASYRYIDSDTAVELTPPKPGELFLANGCRSETVVLRETGDGAEFVAVGAYSDMIKKYGTQK
jgi:hypothetical protein